jgi:hypothetical protein
MYCDLPYVISRLSMVIVVRLREWRRRDNWLLQLHLSDVCRKEKTMIHLLGIFALHSLVQCPKKIWLMVCCLTLSSAVFLPPYSGCSSLAHPCLKCYIQSIFFYTRGCSHHNECLPKGHCVYLSEQSKWNSLLTFKFFLVSKSRGLCLDINLWAYYSNKIWEIQILITVFMHLWGMCCFIFKY